MSPAKKKKTLPLAGATELGKFRKRLTPERALEVCLGEDPPDEPEFDDRAAPGSTPLPAESLWSLVQLAVTGALQSGDDEDDDEDEDEDETDDWGFDPDQRESLESHLRRLTNDYLTNRVFITLLKKDPDTAYHWFWDAVVDQPYIVDEDGECVMNLGVLDEDELEALGIDDEDLADDDED